jgi:hypothetical protein
MTAAEAYTKKICAEAVANHDKRPARRELKRSLHVARNTRQGHRCTCLAKFASSLTIADFAL